MEELKHLSCLNLWLDKLVAVVVFEESFHLFYKCETFKSEYVFWNKMHWLIEKNDKDILVL